MSADGNKDASGSGDRPTSEEAAEWERRLVSGDLPEDFLQVTEPKKDDDAAATASSVTANATATLTPIRPTPVATGALLDLGEATGETPVGRDPDQSAHTEPVDEHPPQEVKEKRPMTTEEKDHAMALALQRQLNLEGQEEAARAAAAAAQGGAYGYQYLSQAPPPNAVGRLTVTLAEAKLARNYGMTRMDPYCRVRVGHCVYETPTCANGAREPKWNKTFTCYLLAGVKNIDIEIYDECTFQADAMIAHATFPIPKQVVQKCEVADEWWPLSGQEGHDKEGMLHMILSLQKMSENGDAPTTKTINVIPGQKVRIPLQGGEPEQQQQQPQQQQQQPQPRPELSAEQLQEFCKCSPIWIKK